MYEKYFIDFSTLWNQKSDDLPGAGTSPGGREGGISIGCGILDVAEEMT